MKKRNKSILIGELDVEPITDGELAALVGSEAQEVVVSICCNLSCIQTFCDQA